MALSRFDAAPLIAFHATKEKYYRIKTDNHILARDAPRLIHSSEKGAVSEEVEPSIYIGSLNDNLHDLGRVAQFHARSSERAAR